MSNITCRDGYKAKGGRCFQVTGKAAKKARYALASKQPSGLHNAMPSNEAKEEVRGNRKPQGYNPRGAYKGQEMEHSGGGAGNIRGGSNTAWHTKHGDRMVTSEIPKGKKLATVSGGTGHRGNTPYENTIVTDPQKGRTPRPINSKGSIGTDQGFVSKIKQTIKGNGDYGTNRTPSDRTGGGQGKYHGYGRDRMGKSKKSRGFLGKRRASNGYNSGGFLNHRRDAI